MRIWYLAIAMVVVSLVQADEYADLEALVEHYKNERKDPKDAKENPFGFAEDKSMNQLTDLEKDPSDDRFIPNFGPNKNVKPKTIPMLVPNFGPNKNIKPKTIPMLKPNFGPNKNVKPKTIPILVPNFGPNKRPCDVALMKKGYVGGYVPLCDDRTGLFQRVQAEEAELFCVDPYTGEEIAGTRAGYKEFSNNCDAKSCAEARADILKKFASTRSMDPKPMIPFGAYVPECNADGTFKDTQRQGSQQWCVDPQTGVEIPGTRGGGVIGDFKGCGGKKPVDERVLALQKFVSDLAKDLFNLESEIDQLSKTQQQVVGLLKSKGMWSDNVPKVMEDFDIPAENKDEIPEIEEFPLTKDDFPEMEEELAPVNDEEYVPEFSESYL